MAHRLDQSTRAIPRGGYRARFSPSGFFIPSNLRSRQNKILVYLSTGRAPTHTREYDAVCVYCTGGFTEDHKGEERIHVRNISDGRTNFVLVWRKILFVSLFKDKHCFVLSLHRLYFLIL